MFWLILLIGNAAGRNGEIHIWGMVVSMVDWYIQYGAFKSCLFPLEVFGYLHSPHACFNQKLCFQKQVPFPLFLQMHFPLSFVKIVIHRLEFVCCRNCEDIAMSFVVANVSGAPPVWVKGMNEIITF